MREEAPAAETRGGSLPLAVKLSYGAPSFAGAAMAIPIAVLMPRFYSDVVLAPLGAISLAIALARAFDALTDPLVGWLSDRTRTRWGRRKPWIAVGTPLAALLFWLLFTPPRELTPDQASVWFGITFASFFLFQTMEGVPTAALGAELTPDYRERSSLFGIRSIFIALGTMVASLLPAYVGAIFPHWDERRVFSTMAGGYALLWLVLMLNMLHRVPERREYLERPSNPLVPGVRRALRNRPFRILLVSGIVGAIPAAIPAILMPYFVRYVLQPEDPGRWVGIFLFVYLGTGLLFVPLWMAVARRIGKLATMIVASSIGVVASLFYFFVGPGDLFYAGCVYFATGVQAMAGSFLMPAMGADVIDYDELRTGRRREAQYTSFWSIVPKFVAIPGSSIPLAILAAVGYEPNRAQTSEVLFAIRFLYSIFPLAFYVTSLAILSRYPISERVHRQIREGIRAHGERQPALDPLTGEWIPPRETHEDDERLGWFLDTFSRRELRRLLERGARGLPARVLGLAAGWLALSIAGCAAAVERVRSGESQSIVAVLAVVVGGLAFTGFLFQAARLRPAQRLAAAPPPAAVVAAHLEAIDRRGAAAGDAEASASGTLPRRAD